MISSPHTMNGLKPLMEKSSSWYLIGQTREKIADCAKKHGFTEIAFADSLEEAMDICYQNAVDGDAVLTVSGVCKLGNV